MERWSFSWDFWHWELRVVCFSHCWSLFWMANICLKVFKCKDIAEIFSRPIEPEVWSLWQVFGWLRQPLQRSWGWPVHCSYDKAAWSFTYNYRGTLVSKSLKKRQFCMLPSYAPCFTDFRTGFVLGHIWCIWYCIWSMGEGKVLERKQKQFFWNQWTKEHNLGICKIKIYEKVKIRIPLIQCNAMCQSLLWFFSPFTLWTVFDTYHMDQFLQGRNFGCLCHIFFKSRAFVWLNLIRKI